MAPLWLICSLPTVEVLAAWAISRRVSWRKHPALITYLLTEALWQPLAWLGVPVEPWSRLIQVAIRTAAVFEVLRYSRVDVKRRWALCAAGVAVFAAALAGMTAPQTLYLARSYYQVMLAAVLAAVAVRRWWSPMLEPRRHHACRLGLAAWLAVIAVSGSFVRGGLGYRFAPHTREVWGWVDVLTYAALVLVVVAMAVAMVAGAPRKVTARSVSNVQVRRLRIAA